MASGFPGSIDSFTNPLAASALNSPSHAGQHQDLNDAVNKIETYMGLIKVIPTSVTGGTLAANGTVTVTSGSAVTINGAFTAQFTNYRVLGHTITTSGTAALAFQLCASGTPVTTNYNAQRLYVQGASVGGAASSGATNWNFAYIASSSGQTSRMDIFSPFVATPTKMMLDQMYLDPSTTPNIDIRYGAQANSTAYDGFKISTTDTFTSMTITVYGYRN